MEVLQVKQEAIADTLKGYKKRGARLITVSALNKGNDFSLVYHLDLDKDVICLKVPLEGAKAKRMKGIYANCDLYEREAREMFGIDFGEPMENLFLTKDRNDHPYKKEEEHAHP